MSGRSVRALASAVLAAGLCLSVPAAPAGADAGANGPMLWYKLDEESGTVAADSSGNGRDAALFGAAGWSGAEGLAFNGTDTYLRLPDDLLAGLESITVAMDVLIDPAQGTPYFIYGFGNTSGTSGDGYLFTTGNAYRTSIASGNWSTEQTTRVSASHNLARGHWTHIAYTLRGAADSCTTAGRLRALLALDDCAGAGTGTLYEDGAAVATNSAITLTPGSIGSGTTTANYIGRSLYASDRYLMGRIRDVRVYDRALAASEVEELAVPVLEQVVEQDRAALSLGDTGALTGDLTLPATGPNGSSISWASSDPAVVAPDGTVTRPPVGAPAATVTLTASLRKGPASATREFSVTVLPAPDDAQAVADAAAALAVPGLSDVRGNLSLPVTGADATEVRWTSSAPEIITGTGEVHRPPHGAPAARLVLTATVSRGAASATRDFPATVPPLPAPKPYAGYLFSYFTGEGTATGEQVYFALSQGNDPLRWRELNGGAPVLVSTLGERGLRDPFIIRSPEGDRFYQIATDLRIYGNGDWDAAQRTGSRSIMVWESTDLVHWTDQRLVRVAPDAAGNTWAPEAFYDPTLGSYVVFWASKLYDNPEHSGSTYNRMMYATTRDFRTFSAPQVWVDRGYSVIDATMIEHDGHYYRFSKDERNPSSDSPYSKFIFAERSDSILDLDYDFLAEGIGMGTLSRGEGPLVFKANPGSATAGCAAGAGSSGAGPQPAAAGAGSSGAAGAGASGAAASQAVAVAGDCPADRWYLFIDEYGGRGYVPFETTDLDSGVWTPVADYALPASPRHGTVLPVTAAEYDRLLAAYAPDQLVTGVDPVEVVTSVGTAPVLPGTVVASYADASRRDTAVSWEPVPAPAYAAPGRFTVEGTVAGALTQVARATVTVAADLPADLLVHYRFDETAGAVAYDTSGHGNHGGYQRGPSFGPGVHGGAVNLSGGANTSTTAPYVTIPNGVLCGLTSVTVASWVRWSASSTVNQWLFGLGPDSVRYLFASPSNGSRVAYAAITTGSWSAESKLATGAPLPDGQWVHLAVTVDGAAHTAALYLDGALAARATGVTVGPGDLYDATSPYSGYIGRSRYPADPYFAGAVDDFRIYSRALPAAEVAILGGNTTAIVSVGLPQLAVDAVIRDAESSVVLPVRPGTDLRRLAPVPVTALGARVRPAPGTVRDLRKPVTYTVTGADGAVRRWRFEAVVLNTPVLDGLYADPNIAVFTGKAAHPGALTGNAASAVTAGGSGGGSAGGGGHSGRPTYYLYPTTDGFAGWSGTRFKAFSSTDLVHWTDHGVILDLGPDIAWADDRAWAPTIAERGGKYYFYFCAAQQIGVAVADSPLGPFTDPLGRPLIAAGQFAGQMIDPAVFTDSDGTAYLYFGNGRAYVVELNADMVSFDPAAVRDITPSGYNEGSFVVKRGGVYYFMWSENDTRDENYRVAYATGPSPFGPWTKRGVILSKRLEMGIRGTGHHSVVRVPGTDDWYIAYHRFALPDGDGTHRETTIDRLEFTADGLIAPVVPTLDGITPLAGHGPG